VSRGDTLAWLPACDRTVFAISGVVFMALTWVLRGAQGLLTVPTVGLYIRP
jgi:hypothetical protein